MLIVGLLLVVGNPVMAQPADKIRLFVEARSEGQGSRDESAARLLGRSAADSKPFAMSKWFPAILRSALSGSSSAARRAPTPFP